MSSSKFGVNEPCCRMTQFMYESVPQPLWCIYNFAGQFDTGSPNAVTLCILYKAICGCSENIELCQVFFYLTLFFFNLAALLLHKLHLKPKLIKENNSNKRYLSFNGHTRVEIKKIIEAMTDIHYLFYQSLSLFKYVQI